MNRPSQADIDRYLDEDSLTSGEYRYVAISFCASETRQKLDREGKVALKIRGAFRTVDDGIQHIRSLHVAKEPFDTYLCDMGKWTLIGNVASIEHPETHLVDMVKAVHSKNVDHKREFEERKERTKEHGLSDKDMTEHIIIDASKEKGKEVDENQKLTTIKPFSGDDGSTTSDVSFSSVDQIKVTDVNFCIVSFVDSDIDRREVETPPGCLGVKFRGAFASKKEAEEFLDSTLSKIEREVDMYIVDMYKWLLLPPDVDDIKDVRYREDYLQEMFSSYEESQKAAKLHHIEREKIALDTVMEGDSTHPVEMEAEASGSALGKAPASE